MLDGLLIFRIASISIIGYWCVVNGPLYIDPKLTTHTRFKKRESHKIWIWWSASPLMFLVPFVALPWSSSIATISLFSLGPLLTISILSIFMFAPERPHMGAVIAAFGFNLIILITLFFRLNSPDIGYVTNIDIPFDLRLEYVKAVVVLWQTVAIYSSVAYLAFAISWLYAIWYMAEKMVKDDGQRFILGQWMAAVAGVASLCVIFGPLEEGFHNTFYAIDLLTKIPR